MSLVESILAHSKEVTKKENRAAVYMIRLLLHKFRTEAWESWAVFTGEEHTVSEIKKHDLEDVETLQTLLTCFAEVADEEEARFNLKMVGDTDEVEVMNAYTDKIFARVLDKYNARLVK